MTHKIHNDSFDSYADDIVVIKLEDLPTTSENERKSSIRVTDILQELISNATPRIPSVMVRSVRLNERGEAILDCLQTK